MMHGLLKSKKDMVGPINIVGFHVMEHQSSHLGQILFLKKE
jgi:hypothetical protein